jgi:hypothetical protein
VSDACQECGCITNAADVAPVWFAGGPSCFVLHWSKRTAPLVLCENCRGQAFRICDRCGAAVESFCYGLGYLPLDYDGDHLCPECAPGEGIE